MRNQTTFKFISTSILVVYDARRLFQVREDKKLQSIPQQNVLELDKGANNPVGELTKSTYRKIQRSHSSTNNYEQVKYRINLFRAYFSFPFSLRRKCVALSTITTKCLTILSVPMMTKGNGWKWKWLISRTHLRAVKSLVDKRLASILTTLMESNILFQFLKSFLKCATESATLYEIWILDEIINVEINVALKFDMFSIWSADACSLTIC